MEFLASEIHYLDHLIPIYKALQEEHQGTFHINTSFLCHYAIGHGIPKANVRYFEFGKEECVMKLTGDIMTASFKDAQMCNFPQYQRKRIFLCEHGHGQTYNVGDGSYAGGKGRGFIKLFLVPGEIPYRKQLANYPNIPVVKTGCPKLDFLQGSESPSKTLQLHEMTVAVSFHWDGSSVCPEAGSAWAFFWNNVVRMIKANPNTQFLAHAHPRMFRDDVRAKWERLIGYVNNVKLVENFNYILRSADLYICDQSSTIYEFTALGKPVILMNSPRFRKDVNHGLRFWELSDIGVNCEIDEELDNKLKEVIISEVEEKYTQKRRDYTKIVYSVPIGEASQASAKAIVDFIEGQLSPQGETVMEQPIIKMKALKLLVQDEGTLFPGIVFQPGFLHSLEKNDEGKTIAVPTKRLLYIDINTRASQMSFHGNAEYVYDEVPIPKEELEEPTIEEPTPEPINEALDEVSSEVEVGEIHSSAGQVECDLAPTEESS